MGQIPLVAILPFLRVSFWGSSISRVALHLRQYPSMVHPSLDWPFNEHAQPNDAQDARSLAGSVRKPWINRPYAAIPGWRFVSWERAITSALNKVSWPSSEISWLTQAKQKASRVGRLWDSLIAPSFVRDQNSAEAEPLRTRSQ